MSKSFNFLIISTFTWNSFRFRPTFYTSHIYLIGVNGPWNNIYTEVGLLWSCQCFVQACHLRCTFMFCSFERWRGEMSQTLFNPTTLPDLGERVGDRSEQRGGRWSAGGRPESILSWEMNEDKQILSTPINTSRNTREQLWLFSWICEGVYFCSLIFSFILQIQ